MTWRYCGSHDKLLIFFLFTQCHFILAVLHKTASANHDKNQKREMRKPQSILSRVRMYLQRRYTGDLSCSVSNYNIITFSFYYCNKFLAFSYVVMTLIYDLGFLGGFFYLKVPVGKVSFYPQLQVYDCITGSLICFYFHCLGQGLLKSLRNLWCSVWKV